MGLTGFGAVGVNPRIASEILLGSKSVGFARLGSEGFSAITQVCRCVLRCGTGVAMIGTVRINPLITIGILLCCKSMA